MSGPCAKPHTHFLHLQSSSSPHFGLCLQKRPFLAIFVFSFHPALLCGELKQSPLWLRPRSEHQCPPRQHQLPESEQAQLEPFCSNGLRPCNIWAFNTVQNVISTHASSIECSAGKDTSLLPRSSISRCHYVHVWESRRYSRWSDDAV